MPLSRAVIWDHLVIFGHWIEARSTPRRSGPSKLKHTGGFECFSPAALREDALKRQFLKVYWMSGFSATLGAKHYPNRDSDPHPTMCGCVHTCTQMISCVLMEVRGGHQHPVFWSVTPGLIHLRPGL